MVFLSSPSTEGVNSQLSQRALRLLTRCNLAHAYLTSGIIRQFPDCGPRRTACLSNTLFTQPPSHLPTFPLCHSQITFPFPTTSSTSKQLVKEHNQNHISRLSHRNFEATRAPHSHPSLYRQNSHPHQTPYPARQSPKPPPQHSQHRTPAPAPNHLAWLLTTALPTSPILLHLRKNGSCLRCFITLFRLDGVRKQRDDFAKKESLRSSKALMERLLVVRG